MFGVAIFHNQFYKHTDKIRTKVTLDWHLTFVKAGANPGLV